MSKERIKDMARTEYRKRMQACIRLGVPAHDITLERITTEITANPEMYTENWMEPEAYVPQQSYTQYISPLVDIPSRPPTKAGLCCRCKAPRGKDGTSTRCRPCANKTNALRNRGRV